MIREKAFVLLMLGVFWGTKLTANTIDAKFELIKGMIIVQASMNGMDAYFILDTGSPTMVLNSSHAITYEQNESKTIERFQWAGIERHGISAFQANLFNLELIANRPIAGLIGYDFLIGYELALDFENQVARLVPNSNSENMEGWVLHSKIPFRMVGHLPVIQAEIGGIKLSLGLDTGANANLANAEHYGEIPSDFKTNESRGEVQGVFGITQVISADLVGLEVFDVNPNSMRFVFADFRQYPNLEKNGVDGLLGFPFFQNGKFSINYNTMELRVWE